jgi:hypothetical protein
VNLKPAEDNVLFSNTCKRVFRNYISHIVNCTSGYILSQPKVKLSKDKVMESPIYHVHIVVCSPGDLQLANSQQH